MDRMDIVDPMDRLRGESQHVRCVHLELRPNLIRVLAFAALTLSVFGERGLGQSLPFTVVQGDGLVHTASGFLFPAQIGEFHRVITKQYDQSGHDVSVGYNADRPQVAATIYVYPAHGKALQDEFLFRQNEVVAQHPGTRIIGHGPASVSPAKIPALMTDFVFTDNFGGRIQQLRSRLLVAQQSNWSVEYRFTYPASGGKKAAGLVDYLQASFSWPPPNKSPSQRSEAN